MESWIRWQGRKQHRPGRPKQIVRVYWEHLAPKVKWAINLKKETYKTLLACGTPEPAVSYRQVKRSAAWVVTETKSWVWEQFGEAIEQDFLVHPKANLENCSAVPHPHGLQCGSGLN